MRTTKLATIGVLGILVLAGCSSAGGGGDKTKAAVELTTSVPAAVGDVDLVNWNLTNGEPDTIDPSRSAVENVSTVVGNMCESLMRFDADYHLVPALAESVEQPSDTVYVFNLRPGVTFWNGTPLTPEDVIYSIKRTADPESGSWWPDNLKGLVSIEKTGALQVTMTFDTPNAQIKWSEATPAMAIVNKAFTEAAGDKFGTATGGVMCTGPFQFDSWRSGQDLTISRYDGYWDTQHKPFAKKIRFSFITDQTAQTAALASGEIDGQFDSGPSSLGQLGSSSEGNLMFGKSLSPVFLSGFTNGPAMSNPEVRQALKLIVDYQGIAKTVYGNAAEPIKKLTTPATWGYSKDIYQAAYDAIPDPKQNLEEAKKLIAKAGNIPPLTIAYDSSDKANATIALSIESAAKQVGLAVDLRAMPTTEYYKIFDDATARAGLDAYIVRGYLDYPEPLSYDLYRTQGNYYNYVGYNNPEYDALLFQAVKTLDDDARAELVTKAEAIALKDGYFVPLVTPYINVFVNKKLTGVLPLQQYLYTPWAAQLGAAGQK